LFPAELFADLTRQGGGHPSVPCEVIGTVMVLQALEGLSEQGAVRPGPAPGPPLALLVPLGDPAMLAHAFLVVVAWPNAPATRHRPG
jgi:hypothetical protein